MTRIRETRKILKWNSFVFIRAIRGQESGATLAKRASSGLIYPGLLRMQIVACGRGVHTFDPARQAGLGAGKRSLLSR